MSFTINLFNSESVEAGFRGVTYVFKKKVIISNCMFNVFRFFADLLFELFFRQI